MYTTYCLNCGTRCLAGPHASCNNCDPVISKLIADVAELNVTEDEEDWVRLHGDPIRYT